MAKVGYIFLATDGEHYAEDKAWMQQYGCVQVIEELSEQERLRPLWKQLIASLERGDELVLSKFSNALRGTRELATLVEFCRIKVVRIISIHDCFDSNDELFPRYQTVANHADVWVTFRRVCRTAKCQCPYYPPATEHHAGK